MKTAVDPCVRSAMTWRLLSLGLAPPTTETLTELEVLAETIADATWDEDVLGVLAAVRAEGLEATAVEYERLFGGSVRISPYEGGYERDPIRQARQLADISGFYRAFGAEAHGPAAERPDHAGCELEFLAFLDLRRLAPDLERDGADVIDGVVESFLRDHPGRWLPAFFARVRDEARPGSVYRPLAALGDRVVAGQLLKRGLAPAALDGAHGATAVEGDSFECG